MIEHQLIEEEKDKDFASKNIPHCKKLATNGKILISTLFRTQM